MLKDTAVAQFTVLSRYLCRIEEEHEKQVTTADLRVRRHLNPGPRQRRSAVMIPEVMKMNGKGKGRAVQLHTNEWPHCNVKYLAMGWIIKKIDLETFHLLSHIHLASTALPWKRNRLLLLITEYRIIMKSVRPKNSFSHTRLTFTMSFWK
jgi:hypothetical protein